jgi:hypothetical protein
LSAGGEETIKEILKGEPLENILGISYRKENKIIHNPNRPLRDADTILIRTGLCATMNTGSA